MLIYLLFQEILCTINRRPIYARFHFMDGQFHTVEFDPSSTAAEVLKLVINKVLFIYLSNFSVADGS